MLPELSGSSSPAARGPAADRPASGPASPSSSAAWPTRCTPRPTPRPPGCSSRTAARWSSRAARFAAARSITIRASRPRPSPWHGRTWRPSTPTRFDAIIVNAAGCGAMLKDYAHLLPAAEHDGRRRFVAKVKDISEFLVALGPIAPEHPLPMKVTYHDACHLCHGQQIRSAAPAVAGDDPRPGAGAARGERALLRRGGDVQPDAARDVRAPRPPQDGPHRRHRAPRSSPPATSAASSRSPARSRSGGVRSRWFTRSICSTGHTRESKHKRMRFPVCRRLPRP